ncbi:MAG: nickel pincer cofactor biosynthesis protein LarC [Chthoniobacterales bacterium]
MKILYLDCLSGISGDMSVGALCDLGVKPEEINAALACHNLGKEFHAHYGREQRQHIEGVKFDVHAHNHDHSHSHEHRHTQEPGHTHEHEHSHCEGHPHHDEPHQHGEHSHEHSHDTHVHGRSFREIYELLTKSELSPFVKTHAISIFQRIAIAEGKIHGMSPEEVTFHEVGAIDSIVDIVGVCAGIEALKVGKIVASSLFEGSGSIQCAHGSFPLPAPATLEILKGIELRQIAEPYEFITPTGAGILAEFVSEFGPMPALRIEKIGYGIGTRKLPTRPNVLRAILGEAAGNHSEETDEIVQIETNIDDLSPEILGYAMEKLLAEGALDVFTTPTGMKKSRAGFLLTVLCEEGKRELMEEIIFRETSAFGLRKSVMQRSKLTREIREVSTPWGPVSVKLGHRNGQLVQVSPEFEACKKVAQSAGVAISEVYRTAIAALQM